MATRGTFAVQHADGSVSQVYSHWDNYLDHNGSLLLHYYNSLEKAEALVALGSISSLASRLAPDDDEEHDFDSPVKGVTVAYHRDRGEGLVITKFTDLGAFYKNRNAEEYNYLFRDGQWFVEWDLTGYQFVSLKDAFNIQADDDD